MNEVFLDLETKKWFDEVGKRDPAKLGVSFVGICARHVKSAIGGPRAEDEEEFLGFFEKEFEKLWPILEEADLIVGYNIKRFDYPVLAPYYSGDLTRFPTLDIFEIIKEETGLRLKLNDFARATLGMEKNGKGEEAIWLY